MSTRFAVITIWAEDVIVNTHFYRDVLGLNLLPHHGSPPHFEVAGVYLPILKGTPLPAQNADSDRFPLFALSVDDLDKMVKRLEEHQVPLPWA